MAGRLDNGYASIYAIIDEFSTTAHVSVGGVARDSDFVEALHFALVTLSTVG